MVHKHFNNTVYYNLAMLPCSGNHFNDIFRTRRCVT